MPGFDFSAAEKKAIANAQIPVLSFPFKFRPKESYHEAPRSFGANRSSGRKHAGIDLYASPGTPIFAMDDGVVEFFRFFALSSKPEHAKVVSQIAIKHSNFVARYCEIANEAPPGIKAGKQVRAGDLIAHVGKVSGAINWPHDMLHLEMYGGYLTGSYSDTKQPPFKRRADLLDPTPHLDKALVRSGHITINIPLPAKFAGWKMA